MLPRPGPEHRRTATGCVRRAHTDTQYAFTRPLAGHFFTNYGGALKVDGEVGNKKAYDPRSYLKLGETGLAARAVEAAPQVGSVGSSGT